MLTFLGYTLATAGVLVIPVILWFLGKLGYKGVKWFLEGDKHLPKLKEKFTNQKNKSMLPENKFASLDEEIENEKEELQYYQKQKLRLQELQQLREDKFKLIWDIDPEEAKQYLQDNNMESDWASILTCEDKINQLLQDKHIRDAITHTHYDSNRKTYVFTTRYQYSAYSHDVNEHAEQVSKHIQGLVEPILEGTSISYRFENQFERLHY